MSKLTLVHQFLKDSKLVSSYGTLVFDSNGKVVKPDLDEDQIKSISELAGFSLEGEESKSQEKKKDQSDAKQESKKEKGEVDQEESTEAEEAKEDDAETDEDDEKKTKKSKGKGKSTKKKD